MEKYLHVYRIQSFATHTHFENTYRENTPLRIKKETTES